MAIDPASVQPGTPSPASAPDISGWVMQQAQKAIEATVSSKVQEIANTATAQATDAAVTSAQEAKDLATQLHDRSIEAIGQVAATVVPAAEKAALDLIPQVKSEVLADLGAVSANVQHDAVTQRHLALLIVLMLGEAAILMLVFYCVPATSPQVKGIIGWASVPTLGSLLVGWGVTGFKTPFGGSTPPPTNG